MSKLIITSYEHLWIAALYDNNQIISIDAESKHSGPKLDDILIGKIQRVIPNLNAAFVEYQSGMVGYLPLDDQEQFVYVSGKKKNSPIPGDELLLQISKEPIRSKDAALTPHLCISGTYCVVKYKVNGILHFSSKIKDKTWKEEMQQKLNLPEGYDITIRTESFNAELAVIQNEIDQLTNQIASLIEIARYRTCYSLIERPSYLYMKYLKAIAKYEIDEVVVDDTTMYDEISRKMSLNSVKIPVRFYQDNLVPLKVVYKITTAVEEAFHRRIWLKSGAFLVIDVTEAMVVIDVNSGKFEKKLAKDKMILEINLEAAEEIFRQLRIRNLSGIIMIDFINMNKDEQKKQLMDQLRSMASMESVPTTVVEMTKLDLVELTRKREKRPLYELLKTEENYEKM